ncbi:MAG: AAA family ATPase [Verrucomicrobiota bacterium]
MKKVIIGNAGSGKSFLAQRLSKKLNIPVIHLDALFWKPGGFNEKRPKDIVFTEIEELSKGKTWIVEGIFGELASRFMPNADELIWLDLNWSACEEGLLSRGSESSKQLDKIKAEENFKQLLKWASEYWTREDLRSWKGHSQLFNNFKKRRNLFRTRIDVNEYIKQVCSEPAVRRKK